jgi:O-antigen/teichoic acid export membrane protein
VTASSLPPRFRSRLFGSKPSVRRNVVANFFATGWAAVLGLVVVPINIHLLGIEAYGLIGVYTMVQAFATLLDAGLSPTLNRELAQLSAAGHRGSEMRTLVRTLEVVYWGVAFIVGVVVVALAPFAAAHWLHPVHLSTGEIERALMLMGLTIAIQWPASIYAGGVQGLQHQVEWSSGTIVFGTLRSLGGVLVLWLVSRTITAFFVWQAIVSVLQTAWLAWFLWRCLPPAESHRPRFDAQHLRRVWRFAAGVSGVTLTNVVLAQSDKVILSHFLPLEKFGYYSLAATLASVFGRTVEPMFYAFFPRFSELVGRRDHAGLVSSYHRACQMLSVVLLPAAVVLALFSREVLQLWTHNPVIAAEAHWLVTLLVVGTALNRLMNLPYALQLAHGWTRLAFWNNLVAVVLVIPALAFATSHWGGRGAATVWLVLNTSYVVIQIPLMHQRVLVGEARHWYLDDVGAPLLAAALVAGPASLLMRTIAAPMAMLGMLAAISAGSLLAGCLAVPWVRAALGRLAVRARALARA